MTRERRSRSFSISQSSSCSRIRSAIRRGCRLANANPIRNLSAKKPPLARMLVSNSSAHEGRRGRLAQSRDRPQPTVLVGTMRKSERNPLNRGWRAGNANVDDGRRTMRAIPGKESCVARASRDASRNRSMAPATAKRSCVFNLLDLQKKIWGCRRLMDEYEHLRSGVSASWPRPSRGRAYIVPTPANTAPGSPRSGDWIRNSDRRTIDRDVSGAIVSPRSILIATSCFDRSLDGKVGSRARRRLGLPP
jgi:hypothetical protein